MTDAPILLPDLSDATVVSHLARRPGGEWLRRPARNPRQVFIGHPTPEGGQWRVDWLVVVEKK
jgi:hypothetical protein